MPAAGKTNASRVQINDRIIVRVAADGTVWESTTKTGESVQIVRVTGKHAVRGGQFCQNRQTYYRIETSAGPINAAPIQTFWLAPEDNAGMKRAHVEALAEDEARLEEFTPEERDALAEDYRTSGALDDAHAEALEENQERADEARWSLGSILDAYTEALAEDAERASLAQARAWVDRHDLPWAGRDYVQQAIDADHAEALTLHSQGGKVDNMNNDASTNRKCPTCEVTEDGKPCFACGETSVQTASTENHTGSAVVRLLEKVWARIREDHPELPEVVIITGSGLLGGSKWGHFRADGWKVREEGAALRKHELFLAGEALAKGATQVFQTMLHEAAHTLAKVRGQQDTSRQGRWHNATFRALAVEMGLEHKGTTADKSHGFSFVTLTAETKARYADLLAELDAEIRLTCHLPVWLGGTADQDEDQGGEKITGKAPKTGGDEGERKSGAMKAVCDCEEPIIIRLSDKVLNMRVVRCDDCEALFHRP